MLSMIAASAGSLEVMMPDNERLDHNGMNGTKVTSVYAEGLRQADQAYDATHVSTHPSLQAYTNSVERAASDGIAGHVSSFLRPIAMSLNGAPRYSPAENTSFHGRAQKTRGKLSSSRRQEVQNMRKQGACIRCRMLRKTVWGPHGRLSHVVLIAKTCQCSGDNPCKACAAVASARVWKLDCIRTSIVREFELYHTSTQYWTLLSVSLLRHL